MTALFTALDFVIRSQKFCMDFNMHAPTVRCVFLLHK